MIVSKDVSKTNAHEGSEHLVEVFRTGPDTKESWMVSHPLGLAFWPALIVTDFQYVGNLMPQHRRYCLNQHRNSVGDSKDSLNS